MVQTTDKKSFQTEMLERAIERSRGDVEGRVVVITGGARGIGKAMAEGLLRAGAKVAIADKTLEGADELRQQLESSGRGIAVEMDVTDDEQIDGAQAAITEALGPADVLVNNAALVSETLFAPTGRVRMLDTSDADWKTMFEVNVFGVVKAIRHFIQPMIDKGSGSIINVVSSGVLPVAGGGGWFGLRPFTLEMPYQSTKAAIMAMTFYLGDEVRAQGVAVNAIMPGHTRASWFDATADAWQEKGVVYGFRPVVAEHLVPITLFLAGQSGSGVTGMLYSVPDWNHDHGYGKYMDWTDHSFPEHLEEMYSKAEAAMPAGRPAMGLQTPAMRRG